MADDVLVRLRRVMPHLRPAERRVAQLALDAPADVAAMTISVLAARAGTSSATIARLCQALDLEGYPGFRLALARSGAESQERWLSTGVTEGDISPDDDGPEVARKLAIQEIGAIRDTAAGLDFDQLDQVVDALAQAPVIDIYGSASSGLAALDLQQKLRRIGRVATSWTDPHLSITSAAVLTPGCVAIAFSHSGATSETLTALDVAGRNGARTVAVTNHPDSPAARRADVVLLTASRETRFRSGALSSRMAQLVIVDVLFLRLAQRNPEAVNAHLDATYRAVGSRHDPPPRRQRRS